MALSYSITHINQATSAQWGLIICQKGIKHGFCDYSSTSFDQFKQQMPSLSLVAYFLLLTFGCLPFIISHAVFQNLA